MNNIILTGFMGCGKTTAGKIIAEKLNMRFIDTDAEIVKNAGMSISEIFNKFGEAHFRRLETETLKSVLTSENAVVSTGGGILTTAENAEIIKQHGICVFIDVSFDSICMRLKNDTSRPLFSDRENAKKLFNSRYPVYTSCADLIVKSDNSAENASAIIEYYNKKRG